MNEHDPLIIKSEEDTCSIKGGKGLCIWEVPRLSSIFLLVIVGRDGLFLFLWATRFVSNAWRWLLLKIVKFYLVSLYRRLGIR